MKKLLAFFLAVTTLFSLFACAANDKPVNGTTGSTLGQTTSDPDGTSDTTASVGTTTPNGTTEPDVTSTKDTSESETLTTPEGTSTEPVGTTTPQESTTPQETTTQKETTTVNTPPAPDYDELSFPILDKEYILSRVDAFGYHKLTDIIGHNDSSHTNAGEVLTRGDWLKANIPFIETPDGLLDRVYYFRWNNLLSNLGKRQSDGKWEFTESSELGTYHRYIDCAQGQHILDARWIRDNTYVNDYIDITPESESYWGYMIASVLDKYYLDGDISVIEENYEKLKSRFHSRDVRFDADAGLYYLGTGSEGQEAGVNGFERIDRESKLRASYTADGSSLEATRDNYTSGAYWSTEGSGKTSAYIEITMANEETSFTGLRLWFRSGKQTPEITVLNSENTLVKATNVKVTEKNGMMEITFDKVKGNWIKIKFKNTPATNTYVSLYEVAPVYEYPFGTNGFWKLLGGDDSYRIGSNSYMAAAAIALSEMATMLGKTEDAKKYDKIGKDIVESMLNTLWDDSESFFFELTKWDKHHIVGKESNCYAPWAFGLIPDTDEYAEAWKYLMDENVFLSEYGITTLEQGNPHYMQPFSHGCLWNGPVWPYTYSLILTAMAEHLRSDSVSEVQKDDYYELIKRYCSCHFDTNSDSSLAIRENHHPSENRWLAGCPEYNHSSFIDNILSGLIGIRPMADGLEIDPIVPDSWDYFCVENVNFRGNDVTVIYDKTGEHYGIGSGYRVVVNGEVVFESSTVQTFKLEI